MAQGRSITSTRTIVLGLLLGLICLTTVVHGGQEWTVGDDKGWSFGVSEWPNGKPIHAGDMLVFKYDSKMHDVVEVDEAAYNACQTSNSAKRYTSGDDHVLINSGKNFFICSLPGHCQQGMKVAVTAE